MKTEQDKRAEGRKISRAIDNYTPLVNTPRQAQPKPNQTSLGEQE